MPGQDTIQFETIQLEIDRATAALWLNRPTVRNAINRQLLDDLSASLDEIERRTQVTTLVVAGRGGTFSTGADLDELAWAATGDAAQSELAGAAVFDRLATLPVISIAAIDGYAVGGGFLLAIYCDLRFAATGARLGFPPAARHWLPPWGLAQLAAWVGVARAQQIVLAGGMFDAAQAERWGLADRVVPPTELHGAATATARELSGTRRETIAESRAFFAKLRDTPNAKWDQLAGEAFERLFHSEAAQAAIRQFVARTGSKNQEHRETD